MVAAALRSRGPKIDCGNGLREVLGACWRRGMEGSSLRRRLDGVGSAAGHDGGAAVPGESEGFGLRLWEWRLRVVWRVSWREGGARGGCGGCRDAFGVSRAQAVSAETRRQRGRGKASAASALQDLQREVQGRETGRFAFQMQVGGFADGGSNGRVRRVSSLRAEGRRRLGAGAARAALGAAGHRAEAASALHSLAARFAGRGRMGGLEATTLSSHPMCSMKCLQGKRGEREGERDGVLGHWQVGSWVLRPTDQRERRGEVRNIPFQGFLERASGRGGVSFAQPCSEIRGQRKNGRLGGDDLRLASYVFDGMPARKERGRNRRERWGAGPLAGGVQGAWAH
uniref:Uncharacterized protein n=1 Tax=Oryza barthii TaxID=65489 RepID=A0A0D3GXI7_9ORYZ